MSPGSFDYSLDALRGLIAAAVHTSKTFSPVASDAHVLAVLRNQVKLSEAAIKDFDAANRPDLKAKEEAQIAVLNGYIGSIPTVSDADVRRAVNQILSNLQADGQR